MLSNMVKQKRKEKAVSVYFCGYDGNVRSVQFDCLLDMCKYVLLMKFRSTYIHVGSSWRLIWLVNSIYAVGM